MIWPLEYLFFICLILFAFLPLFYLSLFMEREKITAINSIMFKTGKLITDSSCFFLHS